MVVAKCLQKHWGKLRCVVLSQRFITFILSNNISNLNIITKQMFKCLAYKHCLRIIEVKLWLRRCHKARWNNVIVQKFLKCCWPVCVTLKMSIFNLINLVEGPGPMLIFMGGECYKALPCLGPSEKILRIRNLK